jgi:hypothetical protein
MIRKMRRVLLSGLIGTAAMLAALASQSELRSAVFEAGSASLQPCDYDGVATAFTTAFDARRGYTITQVVVSDVDFPGCQGMGVQVTLTDVDDRPLGDGSARVSGSSVTVPIVPAVPSSSVRRVHAAIAD